VRTASDLHAYQQNAIDWIFDHDRSMALCPVGCHAAGTKVIMASGRSVAVENIKVGDWLLGPDGTPRLVEQLHRGTDDMYRIHPVHGSPFVVNGGHTLSLIATPYAKGVGGLMTGAEIVNLSVREHLSRPKNWQRNWKLRRNDRLLPLVAKPEDLFIPPYVLGALIGDGHLKPSAVSLTTPDPEIHDEVADWVRAQGIRVRIEILPNNKSWTAHYPINDKGYHLPNPLTEALKALGLHGTLALEKFIPDAYKFGSVTTRLEMLAGLIDTDGYHIKTAFEFSSKSPVLVDDVIFVARSLGLVCSPRKVKRVNDTDYYITHITGNTRIVPTRVPRKQAPQRLQKKRAHVTGFTVEPLGPGQFYGFTLSGDHLYFTDDFIIHHNSGKTAITWTAIAELMDEGHIERPIVFAPMRVAQLVWAQERDQWEHLKGRPVILWGGEPDGWEDSLWKTSRRLWGSRQYLETRLPKIVDVRKRREMEAKLNAVVSEERQVNREIRRAVPPRAVHVISYENALWWCELYEPGKSPFDMAVFDEVGKLKNPKSPRYKALKKHTKDMKIVVGLNATPAPEGMLDLYAQVTVIDGGKLFGKSFYTWRQKFFAPTDWQGYNWRPQLGAKELILKDLNTIAFRVDEADLAYHQTMTHSQIEVDLPPKAREAYAAMEKVMAIELDGRDDLVAMSAAASSMKLRQITSGFIYDEDGKPIVLHEEKLNALSDLIDSMEREPLLVSYEFGYELEMIRKLWKGVRYLGQGVSSATARETVDLWNQRKLPIMGIHWASAGHGVNLQAGGSHLASLSRPWSLEGWMQMCGRIDRQGQTRACFGHGIVARNSSDQRVWEALTSKGAEQADVIAAIRRI
jgi:hypothetical protein